MAAKDSAQPYSGPMLMPAGQYAGRPGIELRRPVYLIGSRTDARIHLQSSTVSRAHAVLVQTRHETYIRDLASRTHVFVNGKRVREAVLRHNDLVAIGKFTFQYEGDRKQRGEEPDTLPAALQIAGVELPVPIEERVILIGRRPGSDITLTEESASSTHAVIFQWEGIRFIRDLGSRTGTFVNGEPIHEVQLNPSDTIKIGETEITYAPSLEEAAFDLITDASDSLVARTPVAEEVHLAAHEEAVEPVETVDPVANAPFGSEPQGRKQATVEPVETIASAEANEPLELAALPLADEVVEDAVVPRITSAPATPVPATPVPATPAPVTPAPATPAPVAPALVSPAPVAPPIKQSKPESILLDFVVPTESPKHDISDLVDLAVEEAEHTSAAPLTPHDTAHIPLAVAGAEQSGDDSTGNAAVGEAAQTPPASTNIAAEALPLSAEIPPAEIQPAEAAATVDAAVEADDLTAITDGSVSPDAHGLELLEDADLPRRGWRSSVVEPIATDDAPATAPDDANAQASTPTIAESETVAPFETEVAPEEIDVAPIEIESERLAIESETEQPQAIEQIIEQNTADLLPFADEPTSTITPEADGDDAIDLSALLAQDDLTAPIDVETNETPAGLADVDGDAAIDLSALSRQDDLTAPIDVETNEAPAGSADVDGDAAIDLSALSRQDDLNAPIDLATDEAPADAANVEVDATIDLSALSSQHELSEPIDIAPDETPAGAADVDGNATIDMSALSSQDDLHAPIDLSANEAPADSADVDGDVTIDLSALSPHDDLAEPIDLSTDEPPADETVAEDVSNNFGIDADSIAPPNEGPTLPPVDSVDLSSIDFSQPARTIADLATPASALSADAFGEIFEDKIEANPIAGTPADEPPVEVIPDEFIPTGEASEEDVPANSNESLSSFKKRLLRSRTLAALDRRRKLPTKETIERTEPTPQSALDLPLPEMPADLPAPPLPLIDASALSDTTFGRAVAEFEGDRTGEIVEDSATLESHEPDHAQPAEAPLFDSAKVPTDLHESAVPPAEPAAELESSDLANLQIESSETHESTPAAPDLDLSRLANVDESAATVDESAAMDFLSEEPTPHTSLAETPLAETPVAHAPAAETPAETLAAETPAPETPVAETPVAETPLAETPLAETPAPEMPVDEAHIDETLADEVHATTDASSASPPPVMDSAIALPAESAFESAVEPQLADVEIQGADIENFEANEEHFLGGEPLSLRDGVHPPAGFGVVSVDFTQPPPVQDEDAHTEADHVELPLHVEAPVIDESHAAPLPESHDILPPEFGDAIVPPQPPTLTSLSAPPIETQSSDDPLQASIETPATFADPFAGQSMVAQVEIPSFDASEASQELRVESDAPLRANSNGKGKGRKSRLIRNGFGQNPDLPKAGKTEIPPFADSNGATIGGMAGMAMDGLAAPPVRNADVFSEMPSRSESAGNAPSNVPLNASADAPEIPRTNMRDVGRAMTNDEWMKSTPAASRSRRRPARVTAITPSLDTPDAEDSTQSSEPVGLTGMGAEYIAPRPAILLEDENIANAAAQRHRRLIRRVPILCATMIALVGVAIAVCVCFLPVTQQIQATMSYRNFDSLTHEEQLKFEDGQNQKLRNDALREQAKRKLQNRHPDMQPGFLNDPVRFANLKLEWPETRTGEPGIAWINYFDSTDKANDPARVQAVAQAMFDANSDMSLAAQSTKQAMDQLTTDIKDETRQLDELKHKIEQERAFLDGRPTLAELNKLKSDDTTLEAAYNDAMAKAKSAQADVDQLSKQHAAETPPAVAGADPVAADAQIKQMSKDAEALNTKIAAARKERADLATKARATLDAAYDEFKKQVQGSQTITKDNPQLAAYVTAAQNLQQAIHQLTDEFIQKEQDEYKQLNDLKSNIVAKIQQRQADLFANDSQLKELNDKKEIATRKYNEAINSGLDKEAGDEKTELSLLDNLTKARKDLLANDQVYTDLLNGLQLVIDQKQHSIDDQRKKTDEQLASMKTAFDKGTPSVDQLPAEQKQLASAMQAKLAQIDAARKQYAEAADASAGDADASVQSMVNDLQTLQTSIETRKRQVAAANSDASKKARDDQFHAALAQKTALLDQLNKQLASAQTAYQANHANLINRQSTAEQSASAAQQLEEAVNKQQQLQAQHDQHQMAWEQKSQEFDRAIEPLEPEQQAHLVGAQTDNRWIYAGVSSLAIVLAFLVAICWTVIGAARESHHAYTPSFESLDTPAKPKRDRNAPMNGAEPEENQAAVA